MDKLHIMGEREIYRLQIMTQLAEKRITQKQAGELLGASIRQIKRMWRRFKLDGPARRIDQPKPRETEPQSAER